MHRIDSAGATEANLFTEGDPASGTPATQVSDDWLNAVQEEIAGVVEAAGEELAKADNTQLATAIAILIAAGLGQPYDVPFIAGWDGDFSGEDLAVQQYGAIVLSRDITIVGEVGHIGTAATGAACIVDVEKNGTTIYSTKPQFSISANTLTAGALNAAAVDCSAGDRLDFKVTQVGSSVKGQKIRFGLKAKLR